MIGGVAKYVVLLFNNHGAMHKADSNRSGTCGRVHHVGQTRTKPWWSGVTHSAKFVALTTRKLPVHVSHTIEGDLPIATDPTFFRVIRSSPYELLF